MSRALPPDPAAERSRWRRPLLLGLVLAAYVLAAGAWAHANGWLARPPVTEGTYYRVQAAESLLALEERGIAGWVAAPYAGAQHHTPLFPMLVALVARLCGRGVDPALLTWTMIAFGALLGAATYHLARSFLGPAGAAAAAALTLATPVVQGYQRDFLPTLPMAAGLVGALGLLVRSDAFGRRWSSLAFGVAAGLSTYLKVIAPLYLLGPAVVAAVLGSRRHGARALAHLALAGLGFLAVMGPWTAANLGHVLDYTESATEAESLPAAERVLEAERWIYYPRAVLNSGFGLPLGVLVVGLVLAGAAVPARRRTWSPHGWTLAALVPVTWLVVSYGQAASGSQYAFLWVPLGCIFAVHQTRATDGRALRLGLALLLAAAGAWNAVLAQRPLQQDRPRAWRGLHVVGATDQYLGNWLRAMRVRAAPEAEPWPVAEFTELVLADAEPLVPRVARTHPVLGGNLAVEAMARRRTLDFRRLPWSAMLRSPPNLAPLVEVDYLVADTLMMQIEPLAAVAEGLGLRLEVLATREVTEHSTVRLVAVRKPWVRPAEADLAVLDEPTVRRVEALFANGWTLRGVERVPVPAFGGRPAVHLFLAPPPSAPPCRAVLEMHRGGELAWSGWRSLVVPRGAAPELLVLPFDLVDVAPAPGGAAGSWRFGLAGSSGAHEPLGPARTELAQPLAGLVVLP